jgi:hypothetical protein
MCVQGESNHYAGIIWEKQAAPTGRKPAKEFIAAPGTNRIRPLASLHAAVVAPACSRKPRVHARIAKYFASRPAYQHFLWIALLITAMDSLGSQSGSGLRAMPF